MPFHAVWVVALVLLIVGLCMMLSVSAAGALTLPSGDKFLYVKQQGITAIAAIVGLLIVSRIDYRKLRGLSVVFLALIAAVLLLMHIPGVSRSEGGASSYIPLGPLTFQPSEFAKLAVVLAGAHLLSVRKSVRNDFRSFMLPFGVTGVAICLLVLAEPDLGTAIIVAGLLLGMLWIAGMKLRHWIVIAGVGAAGAVAFTFSSPVRMARVLSFLNPSADPHGSSFQLSQSLVALGRGGWFGVGPGESVQKFSYLPKAHTDMIFAILGEEFGLIGAGFVILLFGVFAVACWRLARRCADPMGRYLIAGCGMLVTLQAVVNIGGVIGALPLTGVPLPFISYGRNSLIVMLLSVGIILSVARSAPACRVSSAANKRYENVTRIDRRRGDRWARGARSGAG
ncbi:MAG: putative lipid II flippase FtsW [Actinobacteria bacterium]|nr:putative lipid II flippase FtsW [Actinomycetota bacterium]